MTTIISGKLMQVDKSALRNVVRHTDTHNRVKEMDEMWKQRERRRYSDEEDERESERRHRSIRKVYKKRMYSDSIDEPHGTKSTKAGPWTKKLMEYEEKDPDRWGHSGFKELYPEDFETAEESLVTTEKEGILAEEKEDLKDEDIVERWKRGRFRPQVESRRPVRGFDRGRQRFGRGRGNFGGSFRRNITENRPQEGRNDRPYRERRRSESEENYRTRLPGRFDRQRSRSRSASRGRQGQKSRDREVMKREIESSSRKDIKENKNSCSQRGRSRERRDSKTSIDEVNESVSSNPNRKLDNSRAEGRKRDPPKRRWDQKAKTEEEGKQTNHDAQGNKARKNAPGQVEEQAQVESVAKEIRGRWEREVSSDEENAGVVDVNDSKMVDAFGRDISKRNEYRMKQKQVGSRDSGRILAEGKLNPYNKIEDVNKYGEESRYGESAGDGVKGQFKGGHEIEDDELAKPRDVSSVNDHGDDGNDHSDRGDGDDHDGSDGGDADDKSLKMKMEKKKKHKKKAGKKSKYRDSDFEDHLERHSKDPEKTKKRYDTKTAHEQFLEGHGEGDNSEGDDDQNMDITDDALHVESEMRKRIKLKMKQRFEGSFSKKNILTLGEISDERGSDVEDLGKRVSEKEKKDNFEGADGISQASGRFKPGNSFSLTEPEQHKFERRNDFESDSEHDDKRKTDGARDRKQRGSPRNEHEADSKKDMHRRKYRDSSGSSLEDKRGRGKRDKKESLERNNRKRDQKNHHDKTSQNRKDSRREVGKSRKNAKQRADSYSSNESETEDSKSDSDTSNDSDRDGRKRRVKAKRRTDLAESGKKKEKRGKQHRSRASSGSGSASENLEKGSRAKHRSKIELESIDKYETRASRISEGRGAVRSTKERMIMDKGKRPSYSSEKSSNSDSDDIGTKKSSRKGIFKKDKGRDGRKPTHVVDSTSDENSSGEDYGDKKKKRRGRVDREQVPRRKSDRVLQEVENNKHMKHSVKEKMKGDYYEGRKKNEREESDSSWSDDIEDLRKEKRKHHKSKKIQKEDSSFEEASEEETKMQKRNERRNEKQKKYSKEDNSSPEHKRKEDYRKRKKKARDSSGDEKLLKNKKRKIGDKHHLSDDDEYKARKSKKKHKAQDRSEKIRRRKDHSISNSEDSDDVRGTKGLERRNEQFGKHHSDMKDDRGVVEALGNSGVLFENRFGKGRGRGVVDQEQSDSGEERKNEEVVKGINSAVEMRNSDSFEGSYDLSAREELRHKDISPRMQGMKTVYNVDSRSEVFNEEKPAAGANVVENLEDEHHFKGNDSAKEINDNRDNDSSSDVSLYGDIDLNEMTSRGRSSKARGGKSGKASPYRKASKMAQSRESPSPVDNVNTREVTSKNTVRPLQSRNRRSVSRDESYGREERGRKVRRSVSESSDYSNEREGKSARGRGKKTKSPMPHSRSSRNRRSISRDSSSSKERRKRSHQRSRQRSHPHKNRSTRSSVSGSDSDHMNDKHNGRRKSSAKRRRSRSRSPYNSSSSSYSSSVDEEGNRDRSRSRRHKRHEKGSYRREYRRSRSSDSYTSVSSIEKRKRKRN